MRLRIFFMLVLFFSVSLAQDRGQKLYQEQKYDEARAHYDLILSKRENDRAAHFGRGVSAYFQDEKETAFQSFKQALSTKDSMLQSKTLYNIGNMLYEQQKMDESLAFYKKAMILEPSDHDAKINYELIKRQMRKQEEQEQNQEKNQDSNKNDQNDDNQNKKQGNQKSEDQQKSENHPSEEENKDQDDTQQSRSAKGEQDQKKESEKRSIQNQETEPQHKSDRQLNAEAILNALKDNEKIYQKQQIARSKVFKLEKDW